MAARYNLRQKTLDKRAEREAAPAPAPQRRPRKPAATAAAKPAAASKRKAKAPADGGRPKKKSATKAAKGRGKVRVAEPEDEELEDEEQGEDDPNNDDGGGDDAVEKGPATGDVLAGGLAAADLPAAGPPAEENILGNEDDRGGDVAQDKDNGALEEENGLEEERIQDEARERERREMPPPERDESQDRGGIEDEVAPRGGEAPPPGRSGSGGVAAGAGNATGGDRAIGGSITAAGGDGNRPWDNGADLPDYVHEEQGNDQNSQVLVNSANTPNSTASRTLTQEWDDFMAKFTDDQKSLRLKYRPLRSRALLIKFLTKGNAGGEVTELPPPEDTTEEEYQDTLEGVNSVDLARLGAPTDRQSFTTFDDPEHAHCPSHQYNEWALTMIWAQHIAQLTSTADKDEASWRRNRALIQLQALKSRDRWILPGDNEDEPTPHARTFCDGMDLDDPRLKGLRSRALDALSSANPVSQHIPGPWYPLDYLGAGGYGRAYAYGQYGYRGRLFDRVVIKDSYWSKKQWNSKDCPFYWKKDAQDQWQPKESFIMERMQPLTEADTPLVRLRTHALLPELQCYRLYLEFCPHGDLGDVFIKHFQTSHMSTRNGDPAHWMIPESALWCLLERLIDAVSLLHNGHLDVDDPPKDGWTEIVPLDIKPENIFLAEPQEGSWPQYPLFKLGDVGHSEETYDGDPRNPGTWPNPPTDIFRMGTRGWSAPEQNDQPAGSDPQDYRMSEFTSVWACANIVLQAMDVILEPAQISNREGPDRPQIREEVYSAYSEDLREVLEWCLDPTPKNRPKLSALREYIRMFVEVAPEGEDETESLQLRRNREDWIHYSRNEKYKLWAEDE